MSGILGVLLGQSGAPGFINPSAGWPSATSPGGASLNVNNDGTFSGSGSPGGNWVFPATAEIAAGYQIKVDETSGTFTTGTTGTWQDLSTSRSWSAISTAVTFTLSIREKATTIVRLTLVDEILDGT